MLSGENFHHAHAKAVGMAPNFDSRPTAFPRSLSFCPLGLREPQRAKKPLTTSLDAVSGDSFASDRLFLLAVGAFLGVLLFGDVSLACAFQLPGFFGVLLGVAGPLAGDVGFGENGLDRAFRHA